MCFLSTLQLILTVTLFTVPSLTTPVPFPKGGGGGHSSGGHSSSSGGHDSSSSSSSSSSTTHSGSTSSSHSCPSASSTASNCSGTRQSSHLSPSAIATIVVVVVLSVVAIALIVWLAIRRSKGKGDGMAQKDVSDGAVKGIGQGNDEVGISRIKMFATRGWLGRIGTGLSKGPAYEKLGGVSGNSGGSMANVHEIKSEDGATVTHQSR